MSWMSENVDMSPGARNVLGRTVRVGGVTASMSLSGLSRDSHDSLDGTLAGGQPPGRCRSALATGSMHSFYPPTLLPLP